MGTNSLPIAVDGTVAPADDRNDIVTAITNDLVPRGFVGTTSVPEGGKNLGTPIYEWNNLYCRNIYINGQLVDFGDILLGDWTNGVNNGATRGTSGQPQFIIPTGSSNSATIDATTQDLVVTINSGTVTISADISLTGLDTAPTSNNTCDVDDSSLTGTSITKYQGEERTTITVDNMGSEISSLVGQTVALKHGTSEIMIAYVKSTTELTNVYRGFFFDDSLDPIVRETMSDNDTLTLYKLGWVFVEDNGTTAEVAYTTPQWQFDEPSSPATGDYWYDMSNQMWKRYDGASFVEIDRVMVGWVVMDGTNCVAARSVDFINDYDNYNNFDIELGSTTTVKNKNIDAEISVYGVDMRFIRDFAQWNIATDIETGLTEATDTEYYLYVGHDGMYISDERPYERIDLKGFYHPYQNWRCVGSVYNDSSSDFVEVFPLATLGEVTTTVFTSNDTWVPQSDTAFIEVFVTSGGGGGGKTSASFGCDASSGGGGGGASVYIKKSNDGESKSITVGSGGAGGALPSNGGSSSFGSIVSCTGGIVGVNEGSGGAGGVGSTTEAVSIINNGNSGQNGGGVHPSSGGDGGDCGTIPFIGGEGSGGSGGSASSNGSNGSIIGGGGGGSGSSCSINYGGDGKRGQVTVKEYKRAE